MKYCPNCGTELPEGANACPSCGNAVNESAAAAVAAKPNYDHTAEFEADDIENNKVFAVLGYIIGIIGLVIIFLGAKESKYAMFHAKQALKIELTALLVSIVTVVLCWTCIVPVAAVVIYCILFVVDIIAIIQVFCGYAKEPWLVRSLKFLGK